MRAIIVAVDYWDFLGITLPYNRHHFEDVMVVTKPEDAKTILPASANRCRVFTTDAFTRNGAVFNKWLALEEGLSAFGRHGWLCIMDADILWPKKIPAHERRIGCLYGPRRRILADARTVPPESQWGGLPLFQEGELAGYTHIFHADDPHLGNPPWHQTDWKHAGGGDSFFAMKWPRRTNQVRPPFEVLHLGEPGKNWCGRATEFLDGTAPEQQEQRAAMMQEAWNGMARGDYKAGRIKK